MFVCVSDFTPDQLGSILGMTPTVNNVQAKAATPVSVNSGSGDVKLRLRIDTHVIALDKWSLSRDRLTLQDPLAYGRQLAAC